jgi:hypothetical protein
MPHAPVGAKKAINIKKLVNQLDKHPKFRRTPERINLCKVHAKGTASGLRKLMLECVNSQGQRSRNSSESALSLQSSTHPLGPVCGAH